MSEEEKKNFKKKATSKLCEDCLNEARGANDCQMEKRKENNTTKTLT